MLEGEEHKVIQLHLERVGSVVYASVQMGENTKRYLMPPIGKIENGDLLAGVFCSAPRVGAGSHLHRF